MVRLASWIVRSGALEVRDAAGWCLRLVAGLRPLHARGQAHGRLSAKAIDVTDSVCTSAGFVVEAGDLQDEVVYHSPDRLGDGKTSPADDTWAIGVLLYEILTGRVPFPGKQRKEVAIAILTKPPAKLAACGVQEPKLQELIDRLFVRDVDKRLSQVTDLRKRLVDIYPDMLGLHPLSIGRPGGAEAEEEDDDEYNSVTALIRDDGDILRERIAAAERKAAEARAAASPPAVAAAASGALPSVDDEVATRQVPWSKEMAAEAARAAGAGKAIPTELGPPIAPARADFSAALRPEDEEGAGRGVAEEPAPEDEVPVVAPPVVESSRATTPGPVMRTPSPQPAPLAALAAAERQRAAPAAPAPPTAPAPARRSLARDVMLVLMFTIVGGVVGFLVLGKLWSSRGAGAQPTVERPEPTTNAVVASSSASALPSAAAHATASASGAASAAAGSAREQPKNVNVCLAQMFAEGTFADEPTGLDFVCAEPDAYQGGVSMRVKVIRAGGGARGVTQGMHEWSMLGWYEMAAFGLGRALCCPDPPPLKTRTAPKACPVDKMVEALGKAVVTGDDAAAQEGLKGFNDLLRCLLAAGVARTFGQPGAPDPGAVTVFMKTYARVRKAAGH